MENVAWYCSSRRSDVQNPNTSHDCRCCLNPERETIKHLVFKGETASTVWNYFTKAASFNPLNYLKDSVREWWNFQGNERVRINFQVVPIAMLWFLWKKKKRNTILHREKYSTGKVLFFISLVP